MKAQVFILPTKKNTAHAVEDKYETLKDSYLQLSRADNENANLNAWQQKILDFLLQKTSKKEIGITDYNELCLKIGNKSQRTAKRILDSISHIIGYKLHRSIIVNGRKRFCKILIWRTKDALDILQKAKQERLEFRIRTTIDKYKNVVSSRQKWREQYEDNKEEEYRTYGAGYSSFHQDINIADFGTPEETSQLKPRIRVKANFEIVNEQSSGLPCCGTASHPDCSTEKLTTSAKIIPIQKRHKSKLNSSTAQKNGLAKQSKPIPNNYHKDKPMKTYDWDDPTLKLNLAISRSFDTNTAQELTGRIDYHYSHAEHKMRLIFKKELTISEHDKTRLKQLIKDIYGNDTEIRSQNLIAKKTNAAEISQDEKKIVTSAHQEPVAKDVFKRFIPSEDELLKLADEIREKHRETHCINHTELIDFNARIESLLASNPLIFQPLN